MACSIEGCPGVVKARGWCRLHYLRWHRHGDPQFVTPHDPLTRFWNKVDRRGLDECWLWSGVASSAGYGCIYVDGVQIGVHRFAYELLVAPIPEGMHLDHLCRVPTCVNPAHLEPVTLAENVLRGVGTSAANARKTHCKRGHEFTPENTKTYRGHRACRECIQTKAWRV